MTPLFAGARVLDGRMRIDYLKPDRLPTVGAAAGSTMAYLSTAGSTAARPRTEPDPGMTAGLVRTGRRASGVRA